MPKPKAKTASANFEHPAGVWPWYFMAASFHQLLLVARVHQHLLIAMNELGENYEDQIETLLATGCNVFLDSGIFNLTMNHGRKHKMEMYDVLSLPPSEVDGFQELFDKYCDVITKCGDRLWGYIELDQGGMVNKRKTRAVLEGKGFKPIPVYHPLNDGWDYFDELAAKYDRICVGNIIASDEDIRIRLLSTLWERKRRYPKLWIHLLGMTPNPSSLAYPFNSCDSSSWSSGIQWAQSGLFMRVMLQVLMDDNPKLAPAKKDMAQWKACINEACFALHCDELCWHDALASQGVPVLPPATHEIERNPAQVSASKP